MAQNNFSHTQKKFRLDLFIDKFKKQIQKYFKSILFILVTGLCIFGSFMFYSYWETQSNNKAQSFIYPARRALILAEKSAGGNILYKDKNTNFYTKQKLATYDTAIKQATNTYIRVIKQWITQPAGLSAALEVSHFLYKYNKPKQAIELLQQAIVHKKSNLIGFLISLQLGTYLMNQGEYNQAIKNFDFIMQYKKAQWLWPNVLIKKALSYEAQNKTQEAIKIYKKIKDEFSNSSENDKAIQYLNLLKLNKKVK